MRYSMADVHAAELERLTDAGKVENYSTLKIARLDDRHVKIWRGRAKKPYANYLFRSQQAAEQYIEEQKLAALRMVAYKDQQKAAAKAKREELSKALTVGTLLCGSWGYEQTNVEFWQVVDRKGQTVTLRPIAAETVEGSEGFMSDRRRPLRDEFIGDAVQKRIGDCGIRFDHFTLTPCDDAKEMYCSWYA